jgi:hypothetical protein
MIDRRLLRLFMASFWLVACFIWPGAVTHAQSGMGGSAIKTCVARVVQGDTPAAMLRQPGRFDCDADQTKFGPGDYWAISAPLPASVLPGMAVAARSTVLWQRGMTIFGHYADGKVISVAAGDAEISRHVELGNIIEFRLPARTARLDRLLWRIDGAANLRGILVAPRIATIAQSNQANLLLTAVYAAFVGLSIALLIYNLALWLALRHPFQIVYCAMI